MKSHHRAQSRGRWGTWTLLAITAIALVVLQLRRSAGPESVARDSTASPSETAAPNASVSPLHRLEGKWLRPDGGYVLEIRWAGTDGRVDARYLNPRPIYVSRAEASEASGGGLQLLVELQDEGYPGCVYTLRYDAEQDRLIGDYYQAALRERFAVEFTRQE